MKMEQTECSETSAYKIQTPGNYPKESIQPTLLVFKRLIVILFELMVVISVMIWEGVSGWIAAGIIWLKGGTDVLIGGWVNVFLWNEVMSCCMLSFG